MLTHSFHFSQFNNLSVFPEKPKFDSIHTRNIYNKIIIKILGYFWGVRAHILNLVVQDGLKEHNEFVIKIRNAVHYVRSSSVKRDAFKECVEHVKISNKSLLCLDVETKWNSTYLMLDAAENFEAAFVRLQYHDAKYKKHFEKEKIKGPPEKED